MVTIVNVSDNWTPRIGEKIWIRDYFYAGIDEFVVSKIVNESVFKGLCDGIEYRIDLNYHRRDIFIK